MSSEDPPSENQKTTAKRQRRKTQIKGESISVEETAGRVRWRQLGSMDGAFAVDFPFGQFISTGLMHGKGIKLAVDRGSDSGVRNLCDRFAVF